MKILTLRFLDTLQSLCRRKRKQFRERKRWGANWRDMTRSGRRYSRVEFRPAIEALSWDSYRVRAEPGWEWTCPNCKTYSIVTESMMPEILADWEMMAASCKGRGLKIPVKPTAATAGCTNCRFRPGAPE